MLGVAESMGPSGNYVGMLPIWVDAGYRVTKLVYLDAAYDRIAADSMLQEAFPVAPDVPPRPQPAAADIPP